MIAVGTAEAKAREEAAAQPILARMRPAAIAPRPGSALCDPAQGQNFDVVSPGDLGESGRLNLNSRQFMGERLS